MRIFQISLMVLLIALAAFSADEKRCEAAAQQGPIVPIAKIVWKQGPMFGNGQVKGKGHLKFAVAGGQGYNAPGSVAVRVYMEDGGYAFITSAQLDANNDFQFAVGVIGTGQMEKYYVVIEADLTAAKKPTVKINSPVKSGKLQ